jgi:hypothetical protein
LIFAAIAPYLTGTYGKIENVGKFVKVSWVNSIEYGGLPP